MSIYPQTQFRFGYGGYTYWQPDDGVTSSLMPQYEMATWNYTDNIALLPTIDASAVAHNRALGVREATLDMRGYVSIDRGWQNIINTGFGLRTNGQLTPWMATISLGANTAWSPFTVGKIWHSNLNISATWAEDGGTAVVGYQLQSRILDPDNAYAAPAVATPSTVGVQGTDFSTFIGCSLTNGAVTPVVYDSIKSFSISLDNKLKLTEANDTYYPADRIAAACLPGIMTTSRVTITQLKGAVQSIPMTTQNAPYPVNLIIKSPDASHSLTLQMSLEFLRMNTVVGAENTVVQQAEYALFGSSSNGTTNWPIVATYA